MQPLSYRILGPTHLLAPHAVRGWLHTVAPWGTIPLFKHFFFFWISVLCIVVPKLFYVKMDETVQRLE